MSKGESMPGGQEAFDAKFEALAAEVLDPDTDELEAAGEPQEPQDAADEPEGSEDAPEPEAPAEPSTERQEATPSEPAPPPSTARRITKATPEYQRARERVLARVPGIQLASLSAKDVIALDTTLARQGGDSSDSRSSSDLEARILAKVEERLKGSQGASENGVPAPEQPSKELAEVLDELGLGSDPDVASRFGKVIDGIVEARLKPVQERTAQTEAQRWLSDQRRALGEKFPGMKDADGGFDDVLGLGQSLQARYSDLSDAEALEAAAERLFPPDPLATEPPELARARRNGTSTPVSGKPVGSKKQMTHEEKVEAHAQWQFDNPDASPAQDRRHWDEL